MKLIDYLLSESKKGWKWPNHVVKAVAMEGDRGVNFYFDYACPPSLSETLISPHPFTSAEVVTREQYEYALAASKPEWDGDGLPPMGVECEMSYAGDEWHKCVIIAKGEEQIIYQTQGCREFSGHRNNYRFRPIRSEADKKRDKAIKQICEVLSVGKNTEDDAKNIYEYIKSGRIVID